MCSITEMITYFSDLLDTWLASGLVAFSLSLSPRNLDFLIHRRGRLAWLPLFPASPDRWATMSVLYQTEALLFKNRGLGTGDRTASMVHMGSSLDVDLQAM